jgi:uncharacterized repeat protein (TIGR01451 family)
MYRREFRALVGLLIVMASAALAGPGFGQSPPISVRAIAEVEAHTTERGRETVKLAPADRLVSGDWVIYTLEVRNAAAAAVHTPLVTFPVPQYTSYVADSAVGPGTQVSYSVDGGRNFDVPENLKVQDPDGQARAAVAADYTHIRWQLKNALKANSIAFVRFRVRVK